MATIMSFVVSMMCGSSSPCKKVGAVKGYTSKESRKVSFECMPNIHPIRKPIIFRVQDAMDQVIPSMDYGSEVKIMSIRVTFLEPSGFSLLSPEYFFPSFDFIEVSLGCLFELYIG